MAALRNLERGDQFRLGTRAEAVIAVGVRRGQLYDPKSMVTIRQVCEFARVRNAQFYVVQIVDLTASVIDLIDTGLFRVFHVQDHQSLVTSCHVGICPRYVDTVCILKLNFRLVFRMCQVGDVKYLDAFVVADERIAKLNGHVVGVVDQRRAENTGDPRL